MTKYKIKWREKKKRQNPIQICLFFFFLRKFFSILTKAMLHSHCSNMSYDLFKIFCHSLRSFIEQLKWSHTFYFFLIQMFSCLAKCETNEEIQKFFSTKCIRFHYECIGTRELTQTKLRKLQNRHRRRRGENECRTLVLVRSIVCVYPSRTKRSRDGVELW